VLTVNILVTGAQGFIGQNLVAELINQKYTVLEYDQGTDPALLDAYCREAHFVFHLAGVNRPPEESEFMEGNCAFTQTLLDTLRKHGKTCPVMLASSRQVVLDNAYGRSKKAAEGLLRDYGRLTGSWVLIYRLPNVFGKWCRPNYNSVVATFCYNTARHLPITVHDLNAKLRFVYIDDVVRELIGKLEGGLRMEDDLYTVPVEYTVSLAELVLKVCSFRNCRDELLVPDLSDAFTSKLYSTYLSYLPEDGFSYPLTMNVDERGSFTEFIKTPDRGQVSVNISKPGITKGNHWHHSKNEKFLVVSGTGVIRFRRVGSEQVLEYFVSGDKLEVVDIPTGYTHHIENLGDTDMVTIMWASEPFNPDKPDTYYLEV